MGKHAFMPCCLFVVYLTPDVCSIMCTRGVTVQRAGLHCSTRVGCCSGTPIAAMALLAECCLSMSYCSLQASSKSLLASGSSHAHKADLHTCHQHTCHHYTCFVCLTGSSLGGWLALHLALRHPQEVAGLLLLAPALDFTERLWGGLSPQQQAAAQQEGRIRIDSK